MMCTLIHRVKSRANIVSRGKNIVLITIACLCTNHEFRVRSSGLIKNPFLRLHQSNLDSEIILSAGLYGY